MLILERHKINQGELFMKGMLAFITKLLPLFGNMLVSEISPALRDIIIGTVETLDTKAKKTDNPFDDLVVDIIKALFAPGTFK